MKLFLKELFIRPINTTFIIIGLIISIFSFSIGTGLFNSIFNYYNDKNLLYKDNVVATFNFSEEITLNDFISVIEKVTSNEGFFTSKFTIETNEKDRVNFLSGIYGYEKLEKVYPLLEGRYFTKEESISNEKIALVGSEIYDMTYLKNEERYIKILDQEYKVIGKIGRKTASHFGIYVLIPMKALPKSLLAEGMVNISSFYDKNNISNEYLDKLRGSLNTKGLDEMYIEEMEYQSVISDVIYTNKSMYISMFFSIILSLISIFIFSSFWADQQKRNIAIKKVLGANNVYILKQIIMQMLILVISSEIIACLLNLGTIKFLEKMFMIKLTFNIVNMVNMVSVTSIAFILTIINSLWIYKDIFSFDILKFIKVE